MMNTAHSGTDVLAPDAKLRAPRRALPRGTVDCHAHIFDRCERYPLAAGRKYSPPLCTREAWMALLADRPERCVWGSNWPHPGLHDHMPNDTDLLDLLESWLPHDAVREPLFASNAAKLYRLGGL